MPALEYQRYANVSIGPGTVIEPGCVIGHPPRGRADGELETIIGAGCTIRSGTVIYAGARLGDRVQTGHHALIREDNEIGDGTSIGTNAVLEAGNRIGAGCRIHSGCFLELVTLGDEVFVGPNVVFTDDPHPPCPRYAECKRGAIVENRARLGANSTLLPGVRVGSGALVGAGSLVAADVPPGTVAAGNPARAIKAVAELSCGAGLYARPYAWLEEQ
ncbi:MAG TPA: DapH/DapD/GlmU-related protein [Oscillatoriaceae cyanobacterium]